MSNRPPPPLVRKRVALRPQNKEEADRISAEFSLSRVAARVLASRKFKADEILGKYLEPNLRSGLPNPESLKNLPEACTLVRDVVGSGGAIAICCDFDVDGLSGGAILYHFLTAAGVRARVFVPNRFKDGYGLNCEMVEEIAKAGFRLLITVDYGTTNIAELLRARDLGLNTIVIDHHHVERGREVPATIFINPHQEGCGFADRILCAAGLAWYVVVGLRKALPGAERLDAKSYLDLACLGTICDMVPLVGVNRVIARRGLEALERTERPGLRSLKEVIGVRGGVSCSHVSFGIGPRLNAAGRLVSGDMVIDLLSTSDSRRAGKLARKLNTLNLERQEIETRVKEQAVAQVASRGEIPRGIVVWDPEYHTGVVGIVAQRLVEMFYRPAVVLGLDEEGIFKGSVRGISGFSVVDTLSAVGEHLIKYGGHDGAGGLSVEESRVEDFAAAFLGECEERLAGLELAPSAIADTEASLDDITVDLVNELKLFQPFGIGNPSPQLLLRDLVVREVQVLKKSHLKAYLTDGKRHLTGLLWRNTSHPALIAGARVNIVCKPDRNEYRGNTELQAVIEAAEAI